MADKWYILVNDANGKQITHSELPITPKPGRVVVESGTRIGMWQDDSNLDPNLRRTYVDFTPHKYVSSEEFLFTRLKEKELEKTRLYKISDFLVPILLRRLTSVANNRPLPL